MNPWQVETSAAALRRVGKTGEEAAELGKVCSRITIQGIDGVDPESGRTNREELLREMADVIAQCELNAEYFELDVTAIRRRVALKKLQMAEWERLVT